MIKKLKQCIPLELLLAIGLSLILLHQHGGIKSISSSSSTNEKKFITWVDFNATYEMLDKAYHYDVESHEEDVPLDWIELLAYIGAKHGGEFPKECSRELEEVVEKLKKKEVTIETLSKDMKYYNYYFESYSAILGGLVGEYQIEVQEEENPEEKVWVTKYGLKGYSPIAKGFEYHDYDDFGVSRTYGYTRNHLGHDMMGQVGTPVIAVESGYVEALGWNQYGGWRIGIRSFDKKRYYYYAHLRKNFPFNKTLEEGTIVQAGDVIGYLGRTGYSRTENTNNIDTSHLHFGLQLIFDESQKECNNEIWVDCYSLIRFLYRNRSETIKDMETKEWNRVYQMKDPEAQKYIKDRNQETEKK